jgi:ParB-like chromosome segregation protein Spo0J
MEVHEAAMCFPLMKDADFDTFKADIASEGQLETIKLLQGKILDGRHRWRACEELGLTPRTEELPPDTDPVRYVLSLNAHRRHLDETQKAWAGARLATFRLGDNQHTEGSPIGEPSCPPPVTIEEAAEALDVSKRSVSRARAVQNKAIPEIVAMVEGGEMKILPAAEIALLPEEEQRQIAAKGAKEATKEMARRRKEENRAYPSKNGRAGKSKPGQGKVSNEAPTEEKEEPGPEAQPNREIIGVGVVRANEAVDCLRRIPKNDRLRKRGFQIVTDWIKHNS